MDITQNHFSSVRSSTSSTLGSTSNDTLSLNTSSYSSSNATHIGIDLDDKETIIYPNKIVRGTVNIVTSKQIYANRIRVKFKGVECAVVKAKDGLPKLLRVETIETTYFEVETNVWGAEPNGASIDGWNTLEPGEHKFKFALKFPNVNFPPSTESLTGFSIRYIYSAFLDGPVNHPSLRSEDLITTYWPLFCCPSPISWTFKDMLFIIKKDMAIASIAITLPAQVFFAKQRFSLDLTITPSASSTTVASISCRLRQYYEGRVVLAHGTVRRQCYRDLMYHFISVPPPTVTENATNSNNEVHLSDVSMVMPSRGVLPCFTSNHIRLYYSLTMIVLMREPGFFGEVSQAEVEVPVGMANLQENQWGRVYGIQDYRQSTDAPFFFDPSLSGPAEDAISTEVDTTGESTSVRSDIIYCDSNGTTEEHSLQPPSYDSLQRHQRQVLHVRRKERVEKIRYSSRWVKPGMMPELGKALTVHPDFN